MFNFNTNFYELGFNYNALIQPSIYSGDTVITNRNTAPEIFGSFLTSTPQGGMLYSLPTLRNWFTSEGGTLATFRIFRRAPFVAGDFRVTAVVGEPNGKVYLLTWHKDPSNVWVKLPHQIRHCVPTVLRTPGYSINANYTVDAPMETELDLDFGFLIAPKSNNISFNRYSFERIEFVTVPFYPPEI